MALWLRPSRPGTALAVTPVDPVAHVYAADRAELSALSTNGLAVIGMGLGYLAIAFFTVGTTKNLPAEVVAGAPLPLLLIIGAGIYFLGLEMVRAKSVRELEAILLKDSPHERTAARCGFRAVDAPKFNRIINALAGALISLTWLLAAGFAGYCFLRLLADQTPTVLPVVMGCLYLTGLGLSAILLVWLSRQ